MFKSYRNWLNEGYVQDVKKEDIFSKDYDENIRNYVADNEAMAYAYKYENNIEGEDSEIVETEDFKKWMEYELENRFNEIKFKLENLSKNGLIKIWREMTVKDNWFEHLQKQGNRLGIYWSYDKNAAEPHWGYNNEEKTIDVLIESSVNVKYINWLDTIKAHMMISTGDEEKEIRLFKNTPLKIERLWIDLEEKDISSLKNKIFKA